MSQRRYLNRRIALPQDHGSWVFLFSPLLIGVCAAGTFTAATFSLIVAALSAFLLRQPMTTMVKAYSGRRPPTDLPAARLWIGVYLSVALLALADLYYRGHGYVGLLAVPGIPVFAWHLWLVRRRDERRQAGVELVATGVLSLVAPAAFWVGRGGYDALGWWLWGLTWFQSAASIVYAYARLAQREPTDVSRGGERWRLGRRAVLYTSFNLAAVAVLGGLGHLPKWIFLPFLLQWAETVWGIAISPATGWRPTRIGIRQLIVSSLWTVLFIVAWRP